MPRLTRRKLLAAGCASLLYGLRSGRATAAPGAHIALVLPLGSPSFGRAADAVRQGFLAAVKVTAAPLLPVVVHPVNDESAAITQSFQNAVNQGARLIVGPLTRDGVNRIAQAQSFGVRILALNAVDGGVSLPEHMLALSLQAEAEARQVARLTFADGKRSALTVTDNAVLARRIQSAYADELTRQGGRVIAQHVFRNSTPDLLALREIANNGQCDCVLLAIEAERARLARPYVDGPAQAYATSIIHDGPADPLRDAELNGVRFVDMPWFLEPDHPAVMVFARPDAARPVANDFERLYALGIDAWRLASDLVDQGRVLRDAVDGVTGRITLGADRTFVRELTAAQFVDGRPIPLAARKP